MCGILIWLNKKQEIEPNKFSEALNLLGHRGPDAQQMLFFESLETIPEQLYCSGEQLPKKHQMGAIGHTRLSILDLRSIAHQPFVSDDRRYCENFWIE